MYKYQKLWVWFDPTHLFEYLMLILQEYNSMDKINFSYWNLSILLSMQCLHKLINLFVDILHRPANFDFFCANMMAPTTADNRGPKVYLKSAFEKKCSSIENNEIFWIYILHVSISTSFLWKKEKKKKLANAVYENLLLNTMSLIQISPLYYKNLWNKIK